MANYDWVADWNGQNGNVTTVGSATSASAYGTFDQGGNVFEFNETVLLNVSTHPVHGMRGGVYGSNAEGLAASGRNWNGPLGHSRGIGFRVASAVPEPSSLLLGALGTIGLLLRRRR